MGIGGSLWNNDIPSRHLSHHVIKSEPQPITKNNDGSSLLYTHSAFALVTRYDFIGEYGFIPYITLIVISAIVSYNYVVLKAGS
jgi:hypothetical protein